MKRITSLIIIAVTAVVLILGIATMVSTYSITNTKIQETYARDGRRIVSYEVNAEDEEFYVQKKETKFIRRSESYKRVVKNAKLYVKSAKKEYNANKSDANKSAYNASLANYESTKITSRNFSNSLFLTTTTVFFSTYAPIIAILAIVFVVNTKLNYPSNENKRKSE